MSSHSVFQKSNGDILLGEKDLDQAAQYDRFE